MGSLWSRPQSNISGLTLLKLLFFLAVLSLCCFTQASLVVGFPGGSDSKESTCSMGDLDLIPEWKDPLEKGMATHSRILAWRFHRQRSLVGNSPWGLRVGHD